MCGIIGYSGFRDPGRILKEALESLSYWGYDSVGVAYVSEGSLQVEKSPGKIERLSEFLSSLNSSSAIGHTRWATHGPPSKENSHPHTDCRNQVAVIHNGIIENFQDLKKSLRGHSFKSEADSEVIAHLVEENLHLGFEKAVLEAFRQLEGRNAVVAISPISPNIVAARKGSPLIIGIGQGENFIASDIPAFLRHTKKVMYLDDNELAILGPESPPEFFDLSFQPVQKRIVEIGWSHSDAEKGSFPHFLLKEIMEQKDSILRAISQDENGIQKIADEINSAFGTFFTGCGTAGKVCMAAEYLFSKIAGRHVNFAISSEFHNSQNFLTPKTLLVAVSQSGETADVLDAVEAARQKGSRILSLVNVQGSSLERLSDHFFLINAGPEKAVASTKATTSQLALVILLAYASASRLKEGKRLLVETAGQVNDMLNPRYEDHIRNLAVRLRNSREILLIGRSVNYPIALEGAIKIMEVSQIHSQGFAGGELKHGPLALVEKGTPCIAIVANDEYKNPILNNILEIKARGGYVIGISPERFQSFDYWIKVPDAGMASPIVNIIPIQLLAYHLGLLRGADVDLPRNLSKTVTVR